MFLNFKSNVRKSDRKRQKYKVKKKKKNISKEQNGRKYQCMCKIKRHETSDDFAQKKQITEQHLIHSLTTKKTLILKKLYYFYDRVHQARFKHQRDNNRSSSKVAPYN